MQVFVYQVQLNIKEKKFKKEKKKDYLSQKKCRTPTDCFTQLLLQYPKDSAQLGRIYASHALEDCLLLTGHLPSI